jgi:hypothetical protein
MAPLRYTPGHVWAIVVLATSQFVVVVQGAPITQSCSNLNLFSVYGRDTCPVPKNIYSTEQADWAPWSYRPFCVKATGEVRELCVFTSTSFRGNTGLSIVGSPEMAASVADTLEDASVPPALRSHPTSRLLGGDLASTVRVEETTDGRGKGLVATRKIRKWERILVDFPVLLIEKTYQNALTPEVRQRLLRIAIDQLPERTRTEVLALHSGDASGQAKSEKDEEKKKKTEDEELAEKLEGILITNVVSIETHQIPLTLFPIGSVSSTQEMSLPMPYANSRCLSESQP